MANAELTLESLRLLREALHSTLEALDDIGESLLAAQLSTTIDAIDARLRGLAPSPR